MVGRAKDVWKARCLSCDEGCAVELDEEWAFQGWGYLSPENLTRYVDWRREHGVCAVVIERVIDSHGI